MQWAAVWAAEHQTVISEPATHKQPLCYLPLTMITQRSNGSRVQDHSCRFGDPIRT